MKIYENITLSQNAENFFSGLGLSEPMMARALGEVVAEATGSGGVFQKHFREGQGEWPELSAGWREDKRKTDARKFYQSGRVYRTITQPGVAGQLLKYGSSADAVAGQSVDVRYVVGGLWVQVKAQERKATIKLGFVGRYRKSAKWKKLQSAYAGNLGTGSREEIAAATRQRRRLAKQLGIRKQEAVGAKGYRKVRNAKGKMVTKFLLARGNENLAYANVLQRGQFKGAVLASGRIVGPGQLARLKKKAGRGFALPSEGSSGRRPTMGSALGGKAIWGTARPLLPAKTGDTVRFAKALERGVDAAMRATGW